MAGIPEQKDSKEAHKKSQKQPLIPDNLLDVQSQRVFVISVFVLIQAWKLYDLYLMKNEAIREIIKSGQSSSLIPNEWSFVLKYIFLDCFVLWLIPVLRIPRLSYSPLALVTLVIIFSSTTIAMTSSMGLTGLLTFGGASSWIKMTSEKEITVLGDYINTNDLLDQSSHFRGRTTIRYLPDSSIKLNPFNDNFCMKNFYSQRINVPVKVNATSDLDFLQIQHINFDNEMTVLNYTKKDLKKLIKGDYIDHPKFDRTIYDDHVLYLEFSFKQPGYYKILNALDAKGKTIRNYKSNLIITSCPSARFSDFNDIQDRCMDDDLSGMSISVVGVPPLILTYSEEINGKLMEVPNSIVSPEGYKSPLTSRDPFTTAKNFESSELQDISWAAPQLIEVPLAVKKLDQTGDYIFTVNKIVDGFGNYVEYIPDPADRKNFYKFKAHPIPVLSLSEQDGSQPLLENSKKSLGLKISQTPCISCEQPYVATFNYTSEDGSQTEIFSKSFDFKQTSAVLVDKPGSYSLISAKSQYCNAKIGASSAKIWKANLPQVSIKSDPIVDNCVGTTGYKFLFEFSGNGPFEIGYKVSELNPRNPKSIMRVKEARTITSKSTHYEFNYKPSSAGSYLIEFVTLSDKYYRNQVKFKNNEHQYITQFKQKPQAYFSKGGNIETKYLCNGQATAATLHLEGQPPFALRYDFISPSGSVQSFEDSNINDKQYTIETPEFTQGGEHILVIKSVIDSSSCDVDFRSQEIHFVVKKEVPELSFLSSKDFTIVEGRSVSIPFSHKSNNNIDLTVVRHSLDKSKSSKFQVKNLNPAQGLTIYEDGIYELSGFTEDGCVGKISNDHQNKVSFLPRPFVTLKDKNNYKVKFENNHIAHSVCEGQNDLFTLEAFGSKPFTIDYSIKYPNGHVEEKSEQITNNEFTINFKTSQSGSYEYSVNGIYDSVYTKQVVRELATKGAYTFEKIVMNHNVHPLPQAAFSTSPLESSPHNNARLHSHQHPKNIFQTCMSSLNKKSELEPIPIKLTGQTPFSLRLSVYDEKRDLTKTVDIENINSHFIETYDVYKGLGIGSYIVSLVGVIDGNGCAQTEFGKNSEISIIVNDVPKISLKHSIEDPSLFESRPISKEMDLSYYCVGDPITYVLSGVAPFTVKYDFEGSKRSVEVDSNTFRRRASVPGELSILSLGDSSSKSCVVNFTDSDHVSTRPDLKAKVYDLPSVEVSTGESIEEDIQEGDNVEIVFSFTGHPPFKLTYIRTEPARKGVKDAPRIVETEVVENIYSYEHRIIAKLEGTYEAKEVQDAYCIARNDRF